MNLDIDYLNDARQIFCKMINDIFLSVQLDGQYSIVFLKCNEVNASTYCERFSVKCNKM